MKYAIFESGGKQYKAVEGTTVEVDKLPYEVGHELKLDAVLLVSDGEKISVGTPTVKGAVIKTTVQAQVKAPKVIVFKYKPRERHRKTRGHRQQYTRLMIEAIETE
jgi:large subunit ribosomal protein L21